MAVQVRMFASLRDAAGTDRVEVPAGPLPEVLGTLAGRFGEPFASRLAGASVLVDGQTVPRDAGRVLADGVEVALLPPVSGGA